MKAKAENSPQKLPNLLPLIFLFLIANTYFAEAIAVSPPSLDFRNATQQEFYIYNTENVETAYSITSVSKYFNLPGEITIGPNDRAEVILTIKDVKIEEDKTKIYVTEIPSQATSISILRSIAITIYLGKEDLKLDEQLPLEIKNQTLTEDESIGDLGDNHYPVDGPANENSGTSQDSNGLKVKSEHAKPLPVKTIFEISLLLITVSLIFMNLIR